MLNPKVSIIVPVYNVEPYLERCLESLVKQTLSDIEIIVVNDGSPDNCQSVIDNYVSAYPSLVFSYIKENGGLSDARNYGLRYARGTFIGFVDSDDYVDLAMYEKMYTNAIKHDSDIVVCGYFAINEEKKIVQKLQLGNTAHFNATLAENPKLLYINAPYAWNKLYRKTLFEQSGLRFPKDLIFEDIATVYPLLSHARKITKVNEPLYYYLKRKGSITGNISNRFMQLLQALSILNEYYVEKKQFAACRNELLFINLKHIYIRFFEFPLYNDHQFQRAFLKNSFYHLSHYFPDWKNYHYFFNFHYKQYPQCLITNYLYWIAVISCPKSILNKLTACLIRYPQKMKCKIHALKKKMETYKNKKISFQIYLCNIL